jgi:hypothetical protein
VKFNKALDRTVSFRIDKFEEEVGPVFVRSATKPMSRGQNSEEVFQGWITSEIFSFSLKASQKFPISIRGFRYPRDIGDVIAKETNAKLLHDDKNTWDSISLYRGSKSCHVNGFCIHEENGQDPCLPSVELVNGIIRNNKEVWVLRTDGPPVQESKLVAKRAEEIITNKEIDDRAKALLEIAQPVHRRVAPTVSREPVAPPSGPIGGTGVVTAEAAAEE